MLFVHHIGARSGSHPFPLIEEFNKDIFYVMYDADPDCISQIESEFEKQQLQYKIISYGVGEKKENRKLRLNYDPNTSSFLDVNTEYLNYYYQTKHGYDYVVGDTYSLVKECPVELDTLDELCLKHNILYPDFLSMDTQGTELEILKGANNALSNTVAILTEVAFLPIYKNQPLFKDIDDYLIKHGFKFCKFHELHREMSPYRGPIGTRGKGIMVAADAIYLKDPEFIANSDISDNKKYDGLMKLSYIAITYGMLEYSLHCIKLAKQYKFDDDNNIFSFMTKLYDEAEKIDNYPKIFSDLYSVDDSLNRFEDKTSSVKRSRIKDIIKNSRLFGCIRIYRRAKDSIIGFIKRSNNLMISIFSKNTALEDLLITHGMKKLALEIKRTRLGV